MAKPIGNPISAPLSIHSTTLSPLHADCSRQVGGGSPGASLLLKLGVNGGPYSPRFPSYEEGLKDCNWVPVGIGPANLLKDRFKYPRKFKFASSWGIFPFMLLHERSNDSSCLRFLNDNGILPNRELWERFSTIRAFKFPNSMGISPWKAFFDKSMLAKILRISVAQNFDLWRWRPHYLHWVHTRLWNDIVDGPVLVRTCSFRPSLKSSWQNIVAWDRH